MAIASLGIAWSSACSSAYSAAFRVDASPASLASASDRTAEVGTGRFDWTSTSSTSGLAEMSIDGQGEFDVSRSLVRIAVSMRPGELDDDVSQTATELLRNGEDDFLLRTASCDRWVRYSRTRPDESATTSSSTTLDGSSLRVEAEMYEVGFGGSFDPHAILDHLRHASSDVLDRGPSNVRGVPTRQFVGTLDANWVADRSRGPAEVSTVRFTADIDGAGLVRRVALSFELSYPKPEGFPEGLFFSTSWTNVVEFYDFDDEVDIEVPTETEIISEQEASTVGCYGDD
jgi:hypothetical protein